MMKIKNDFTNLVEQKNKLCIVVLFSTKHNPYRRKKGTVIFFFVFFILVIVWYVY